MEEEVNESANNLEVADQEESVESTEQVVDNTAEQEESTAESVENTAEETAEARRQKGAQRVGVI